MKRLTPKTLAALGFLVYFASYMTRNNYDAISVEIIDAENIRATLASLAMSLSSITYGVGQLVSGFIGDKFSPYRIIFTGLLSSAALNILMASGFGIEIMCVIWALNGFAQSLIWPPLIRILAENMTLEEYKDACVTVNAGGSFGTVSIYLISTVLIRMSGWRLVFFTCATVAIIATAIFWLFIRNNGSEKPKVPATVNVQKPDEVSSSNSSLSKVIITSGLLFICFGILFQGMLRDGITRWTPEFLSDTFNVSNSESILSTVAVPIFSIISFKVTSLINKKLVKNELMLSIILFMISAICTGLSTVINVKLVCVFLVSLATGCMHGVNLLLVCQIPGRFVKYGKASFISGSMNFFTYVGAAISTYGIAFIAEKFNWTAVLLTCSAIAGIGIIMCIIANRNWKKFAE